MKRVEFLLNVGSPIGRSTFSRPACGASRDQSLTGGTRGVVAFFS
jgi:hypothetical protein